MRKKWIAVVLAASMALMACSCGNAGEETSTDMETSIEDVQGNIENEESQNSQLTENEDSQEENSETAFSFEDLRNTQFVFASGAGAWSTMMTVGEDGSFKGTYYDRDMGSSGEGYPNGTEYFCEFTGQFMEPVKVNDYTYSVQISKIQYANEVGTEEILDDVLYCYSDAYGLEGTEEILIYLPGAPMAELPQSFISWVKGSYYMETEPSELPFYGLYNEAQECGFSSYHLKEIWGEMLAFTEELAAEVEHSIQNDAYLTQAELNEKSKQLYDLWDSDLNAIWDALKRTQDAETMEALLAKQREWIVWKEEEVAKAGAEYEGGSMQPMVMNLKAAEMTKARVYELLELLD